MTDTVITVQGRYSERVSAERGTVRFSVHAEGSERGPVIAAGTTAADALDAAISARGDAVVARSADQVRTWVERPWSNDGRPTDPVVHTQADLTAVLADFAALSGLIDDAGATPGVTVQGIDWTLTDATRTSVIDGVRRRAVEDARTKAVAYATAIGLHHVVATAVADAGMLDGSAPPAGGAPFGAMRAMAVSTSDSGGIMLAPQPIEVEAVVDARFSAS